MLHERRVFIADADKASAERTAGLLQDAGFTAEIFSDGRNVLAAVSRSVPFAVVADAVLPGADGYSLAKLIRRADVPVIPGVVVAHHAGMARKIDIPGCAVIAKPFDAETLVAAVMSTAPGSRLPSAKMLGYVNGYLEKLRVPRHRGREYIACAVCLMYEDMTLTDRLTKGLYPMVAERYGVNSNAVERAMRHVTDKAWGVGDTAGQYEIFKNTIDAARGKPTCGGMIAQLAHMLRMEVL